MERNLGRAGAFGRVSSVTGFDLSLLRPGTQLSAVPKLTTGQIYNLCAPAVSLGAGGNVPGGSPRGRAALSPSEDTPPIRMPVPGKNGLAFVPMNEDAAKVENPLAGRSGWLSWGLCKRSLEGELMRTGRIREQQKKELFPDLKRI